MQELCTIPGIFRHESRPIHRTTDKRNSRKFWPSRARVGQLLPTHQACPPEEPSPSPPPPRPRNCTLSATTSTLLLLEPSWASQVRYCNLPSTKMGSPFFLYVAMVSPSSRQALMSKKSTSSFLERTRFTAMPKEHTGTPA